MNYRHKHSRFFGRCIGHENSRGYFLLIVLNLLLIGNYILITLLGFSKDFESSSWILNLFEGVYRLWDYSLFFFAFTCQLAFVQALLYDDFIWLLVAISQNMTLSEVKNVWASKHCFEVKSQPGDSEGKNYF